MDAYATAGVFRRVPYAVVSSGMGSQSSHHQTKIPVSVGRRKWMVSGFSDEGHLGYYSTSRRRIRCEVELETPRRDGKVKEKKREKMMKKRSKLLKNLSKDLSTLTQIGFGLDCSNPCDLVDQDQEQQKKIISEAAEALLTQLQKLRAEEKEAKRKEEKCKCEDSSSSSESSDGECEEEKGQGVVNMNKMKTKPVVEEKSPLMLSSMLTTMTNTTTQGEAVIVVPPESQQPAIKKKDESSSTKTGKKIEVCMGGKCKKLGAEAILEEFERVVVGMEGESDSVSVCGCKCLGKCKVAPNLRLSTTPVAVPVGGLSWDNNNNGVNSNSSSLRLGVALEDVSLIASNFLRQDEALGLAASSSLHF